MAACDPPLAPGMAALSLSLGQHKVDSHSRSAADSPSGNDWIGQSQPAAEQERRRNQLMPSVYELIK